MSMLQEFLRAIQRDEEGATALEYGVLVVFIVIALTVGVGIFGQQLSAFFSGLAGRVPLG